MDSVMKTGTCLRPSCTAMVCPTISGTMVERRDHVLITRLSPRRFISTTLFIRWSSTNGPFFTERGICSAPSLASTTHDESIRGLGLAGAAFLLAPRAGGDAAAAGLPLASTQRVIHRVHGHAADGGSLAEPPAAARLAQGYEFVLGVPHLADRGPAPRVHHADLARGHAQG